MKSPRFSSWIQILTACALSVGSVSCGKFQSAPDRVVVVHDASPTQKESDRNAASLQAIQDFIDLYFGGGGVTREGLANLFSKYRPLIEQMLQGTQLTPDDVINLIFDFDSNHDGRISVGEINDGLNARFPILRWIPDNQSEISLDELKQDVAKEYGPASDPALSQLSQTLLRYDEPWAGGNANSQVGRQELASAGLVLGFVQNVDFSKPLTGLMPPTSSSASGSGAHSNDQALFGELIKLKLNEQLFLRQSVASFDGLTLSDRKLEAMNVALELSLLDKLIKTYSADGKLAAAQQAEALSKLGPKVEARWQLLRKFYDSPLMAGDGDGTLNALESFSLLTDISYAQKLLSLTSGDFSSKAIRGLPKRQDLETSLNAVFPRVGTSVFRETHTDTSSIDTTVTKTWTDVRVAYWDDLKRFDNPKYGGNGDGKLDAGEVAFAVGTLRLLDTLYALYDSNHDGKITKTEAAPLFARLGIKDSQIIDAFFADLGLDGSTPDGWDLLKNFFSGKSRVDSLEPYDFYVRMIQILPGVFADNKAGPT